MPSDTPEKSTSQLAVWRELLAALDRLDAAWLATQPAAPGTQASAQLPGNVAVALVKASERGTRALAGIAETLVEQYDSGEPFRQVAFALRRAIDAWPAR